MPTINQIKDGLVVYDLKTYEEQSRRRLSRQTLSNIETRGFVPDAISGGLSPEERSLFLQIAQREGIKTEANYSTNLDLTVLLEKIERGGIVIPSSGTGFSQESKRKIVEALVILDFLSYRKANQEKLTQETFSRIRSMGISYEAISGLNEQGLSVVRSIGSTRLTDPNTSYDLDSVLSDESFLSSQIATVPLPESLPEESTRRGSWFEDHFGLNGTFRLRYQGDKKEGDDFTRHRGRYKIGLGMDFHPTDWIKMNFGLISGEEPRSPNNTMALSAPCIGIDSANLILTPLSWMEFGGGRVGMPLVMTSDLAFDKDIAWDGGYLKLFGEVADGFSLNLSAGIMLLREDKEETIDPMFFPVQAGFKWTPSSWFSLSTNFAYYGFAGIEDREVLENRSSSDTNEQYEVPPSEEGEDPVIRYSNDYDLFGFNYELTFKAGKPFAFTHYGDFITNPHTDDVGYLFGAKFSFADKRFVMDYSYRRLESDVILDAFPDSDCYGGATDITAHEVKLKVIYWRNDNVTLGGAFDFYHSDRIRGESNPQNLWQIDPLELEFEF